VPPEAGDPANAAGEEVSRCGSLVLIVGPSGAGKDTVMRGARELLAAEQRIVFLRRWITRPANEWEDHHSLSEEAFDRAKREGQLALWWTAHGLSYGIPASALGLVHSGRIVVCNGSRGVAGRARMRFQSLRLVYVTARREVLMERLEARGREADIAGRLARLDHGVPEADADLVIRNEGTVESAAASLAAFLRRLASV
jgi:ribose 1,5-bisphosphokinase